MNKQLTKYIGFSKSRNFIQRPTVSNINGYVFLKRKIDDPSIKSLVENSTEIVSKVENLEGLTFKKLKILRITDDIKDGNIKLPEAEGITVNFDNVRNIFDFLENNEYNFTTINYSSPVLEIPEKYKKRKVKNLRINFTHKYFMDFDKIPSLFEAMLEKESGPVFITFKNIPDFFKNTLRKNLYNFINIKFIF